MAIYSLQVKPASRGAGKNAVAMAAYRNGIKLIDQRTGEIKDYSHKQGISHTALFFPEGVNFTRQQLWNMAELSENRKDARIAREILIALPHELTPEERINLASEFAKTVVKSYNIAVDLALHAPDKQGDQRNFHAHLLLTTRQITPFGLTEKSYLEREDKFLKENGLLPGKKQILAIRQHWEKRCNLALERAGREERVTAKSNKARNLPYLPTIHIGKAAIAMERKGIYTYKGNKNRAINHLNQTIYLRQKQREKSLENKLKNSAHEVEKLPISGQQTTRTQSPREAQERPITTARPAPERPAQEQQKPIQRPKPQPTREVGNRPISGQHTARPQQPRETQERPITTPRPAPERTAPEQQKFIQREEDKQQQVGQDQPKKSTIASLLENAKSKTIKPEIEQGQKLSIKDLLKQSKDKNRNEINRDKDGIER